MQCCICLQEPKEPIQTTCCKNWFCGSCLEEWNQVKNTCPLCGTLRGNRKVNKLAEQQPREFDNGFMMIEQEISQITARVGDVSARVYNRSESSQNIRSTFSRSHIMFLEDQIALVKIQLNNMNEKWFIQDRVATVETMQVITELLITIEAALNDRSIGYEYDPYDIEFQEDFEDWEGMDEEFYDDYEDYEVIGKKKLNQKGGRKSKGSFTQQEEAVKKGSSKVIRQ